MKKVLACILIAALLCSCAGWVTVQAQETLSGSCGENLKWMLANGTLTISGKGKMDDFTVLPPRSGDRIYYYMTSTAPWYESHAAIESVTIGNGVTAIGDYAFAGCEKLRRVTISETVTRIGGYAFGDCNALTEAAIPNGAALLGDGAFFRCENLMRVTLPQSLRVIGSGAFKYCRSLEAFSVPTGVTSIGEDAFFGVGCVNYVGDASGRPWGGNVNKYIEQPYVFDSKEKKTLLWCSKTAKGQQTIPNSVEEIAEYAFYKCALITGVTFPDSVISIGDLAFADCTALEEAAFGKGLKRIGCCAFNNCADLRRLTIPNSVTKIESSAFCRCTDLTEVTLGSGLTEIEIGLFDGCIKLAGITIPAGITAVDSYAFNDCDNLQCVNYGGTQKQWNNITVYDHNEALTKTNVICKDSAPLFGTFQDMLQKLWSWVQRLLQLIPGLRIPF